MTDIHDAITVTLTGDDSETVRAAANALGLDPQEWARRQLRRQAGFDALYAATREWADRSSPESQEWAATVRTGTQELWRRSGDKEHRPNGWDHRDSPQG
jgi:hypothetical protein